MNIIEDKKLEELIQKEKQEYFRKWRKNNPDKVKKYNQTYWIKRAEKRLEAEKENPVSTE